MATFLYRLGWFSFRRRRMVLAVWLVALSAVGIVSATVGGTTDNQFAVPGTEAQTTLDRIKSVFPEQNNGSAEVVFAVPEHGGIMAGSAKAAVEQAVARIAKVPGVAQIPDPYSTGAVSADGQVALGLVSFNQIPSAVSATELEAVKAAAQPAASAGVQVVFGGNAFSKSGEIGSADAIGAVVAAVVLAVALGSLVAAGLPLVTALLGLGMVLATLTTLAGSFDIISTAPALALMVGLAVGIDYALFLIARYRRNLLERMDFGEAAARANATAGSAVVFAGLTVMVALLGLAIADVPFLTVMGSAAAGAVAVAVLVAVTLVPALLGFAGDRINRWVLWRPAMRLKRRATGGERWAGFVARRPWAIVAAGLITVTGLALPVTSLALGLPSPGSQAVGTDSRTADDLVSAHFGPGYNAPLVVAVDSDTDVRTAPAAQAVAHSLAGLPGVQAVLPPTVEPSARMALITVIPTSGADATATTSLVNDIRDQRTAWEKAAGAQIDVTGTTAANIDISAKLGAALPPFVAVIVVVALLLLIVAFRSVLVPVKAVVGFLLSVIASLGAVVAVYQWGWLSDVIDVPRVGPVVSFVPILLVSVLFGLAMDYELFLVAGMKEAHTHGAAPRKAVTIGVKHGARVVTAAALIMISVFGSTLFDQDPIIQPIGFSLAVGVLVDAFVVRMALVPAVMVLLGKAAWWFPKRLDRLVPEMDMEGRRLVVATEHKAGAH